MRRDLRRRTSVLDRRRKAVARRNETGRASSASPPLRVGVIVPVHNEERLLPATLACLGQALERIGSAGTEWRVVVVLDRCADGSADVVEQWRSRLPDAASATRVELVAIDAGNVGTARRTGCEVLLRHWSDVPPGSVWLATTDADSEVPPEWLTSQIRHRHRGAEVWVGRVAVHDWNGRPDGLSEEWQRRDAAECLPVHGANLALDGATYRGLGGFEDLATGEDRALVRRALEQGCVIHPDRVVRVATSSRRTARAPRGFAHALDAMEVIGPTVEWVPPDNVQVAV